MNNQFVKYCKVLLNKTLIHVFSLVGQSHAHSRPTQKCGQASSQADFFFFFFFGPRLFAYT